MKTRARAQLICVLIPAVFGLIAATVRSTLLTAGPPGDPVIDLRNARELPTTYRGAPELTRAFPDGETKANALASADFDEDGMPDLICGYGTSNGGVLTLQRGNVDAFYPNAPEARVRNGTKERFFAEAKIFAIPANAELVGVGDFDADGHFDVVAAARGSDGLYLLRGDGRGNFATAERIEVGGFVSALATGEINRPDGLTDVVVGVTGSDGHRVLVFESPEGALRAAPEVINLPSSVTALSLGQRNASGFGDLLVTAGNQSLTVMGRDRRLSLSAEHRSSVERPAIVHQAQPTSAATPIPSFSRSPLLAIRLNANASSGFVALSKESNAPQLVTAASGPIFLVNTTSDTAFSSACINGTAGCSLRAAITAANANNPANGIPSINFAIASGLQTIVISSALPVITAPVTIDGTTQPGFAGTPIIQLTRDSAGDIDGLVLQGGNSLVRGLVINNFTSGSLPHSAIVLTGSDNIIEGNYLGTNAAGDTAFPNGVAITVSSGSNRIGGTVAAARNVISGNNGTTGIIVLGPASGGGASGNNIVSGNYIGTNAAGTAILANTSTTTAIAISSSTNQIGGTVAGARNLIAGYNRGVYIFVTGAAAANANLIQGNYIGTDVTGTIDLGNTTAVLVSGSSNLIPLNTLVGGATGAARNIISGNQNGVVIGGAHETLVQGNYIGTTADGMDPLRNANIGVQIANIDGVDHTTVGGPAAGAGNLISGNNVGIYTASSAGQTPVGQSVQGNLIGTNVQGDAAIPNDKGLELLQPINVGGATTAEGNVISGNNFMGIDVRCNGIYIKGNFVGTQSDGITPLGNGHAGIFVLGNDLTIGGIAPGEGNVIAYNGKAQTGSDGVDINLTGSPHGIKIRGNSIYSNGLSSSDLGIDIAGDGRTADDACDGDSGANNKQNFPVLTSATFAGNTVTISGSLDSIANQTFTLDFYSNAAADANGLAERQTYLGSATVSTDAAGSCVKSFSVVPFNSVANAAVPAGRIITATATDSVGNTSEFSDPVSIIGNVRPIARDDRAVTNENTASSHVQVLANDSDVDSDTLTVTAITQGANGATVTKNADQTATYNPAPNFKGLDSFTYTISDGHGHTASATVSVTVSEFNDPPVAHDDSKSTNEDIDLVFNATDLLSNDSPGPANESDQTLTVTNVGGGVHGTATLGSDGKITFRPSLNYNGPASFTYIITDNGTTDGAPDAKTASAIVHVTVVAVNDKPSFTRGPDQIVNEDAGAQSIANWATNFSAGPPDESAQTLTFVVTNNSNAALFSTAPAISPTGTLSYTAVANASGAATITLVLRDNGGTANQGQDTSLPQTFTITVNAVNDPPTLDPITPNPLEIQQGADTQTINLRGISAGDGEQTLAVTAVSSNTSLISTPQVSYVSPSATGSLSFRSETGVSGSAKITVTVKDNGGTANGGTDTFSRTFVVNVVNRPPEAHDLALTIDEDAAPIPLTLNVSDPDGGALTYNVMTGTALHGTLSGTAPNLSYMPDPNFNGVATFNFKANDGQLDSNNATVTITVNPVNDAPLPQNDNKMTAEGSKISFAPSTLLANDAAGPANESDQILRVSGIGTPAHGTVTSLPDAILYTPTAGYNGTDSFSYTVTDNGTSNGAPDAKSAHGMVIVTITPFNAAPVARDGSLSTNQDVSLQVDLAPLVSDQETASSNLTYDIVRRPTLGALPPSSGPTFTYTPGPGLSGDDSFSYSVTDRGDPDNCGTATASCAASQTSTVRTIKIKIVAVNRRPVAESQNLTTDEDTPVDIMLRASDPEGAAVTFTIVRSPTLLRNPLHGILSEVGTPSCGSGVCTAKVTYTPHLNFFGHDSFTFKASDGNNESLAATVSLTVNRMGKIAFASVRDGNPEIYVMHEDGTYQTRVTTDPGRDVAPAWSPDGSKIALYVGGGVSGSGLYLMNSDGSGRVRLTAEAFPYSPAWSPDGSQLAFTVPPRPVVVVDKLVGYDSSFAIYVMSLADRTVRRLTLEKRPGSMEDLAADQPTWAPDGSQIAFSRQVGDVGAGFAIYTIDADGAAASRQLSSGSVPHGGDFSPNWSLDGARIAFERWYETSQLTVTQGVFTMDADGSNQRQVFTASHGAGQPTWSPDSSRLACVVYAAPDKAAGSIWTIDASGGNPHQLTAGPVEDFDPAWRPGVNHQFVGQPGADWNNPSNWLPNSVPGRGDSAALNNGQRVSMSSNVLVGRLSMTGDSTIVGATNATVTVATSFDFSGGSVDQVHLIIPAGAEFNVSGDAAKTFSHAVIDNFGTTTIGGKGPVTSDAASIFNNKGLVTFATDRLYEIMNGQPSVAAFGKFNNSSKVTLNGGTLVASQGYEQRSGETDLGTRLGNDSGFGLLRGTIQGNTAIYGGSLTGSGTVDGDLFNESFVLPGHSTGIIKVTGNYTQKAGATLVFEIGGFDNSDETPEFDQLQVSGVASLNGTLNVRTINGFNAQNQRLAPITYQSRRGAFSSLSSNAVLDLGATEAALSVNASAPTTKPGQSLNISTRGKVEAGDNVLIGGFIVQGPAGSSKKVIVRAIGPSLAKNGVGGVLADPTLTLFDRAGHAVATNNNWKESQESEIEATTIPPADDLESAIVATLGTGAYTAIVSGVGNATGVGLVEVYDLDQSSPARLANISTRGHVQTGENVMIGGFIVGGSEPAKMLVRAVGPSLAAFGVTNYLQDPQITLFDSNGNTVGNDNWHSSQENDILATKIPPADDLESAISATLVPGSYTAIVRGAHDASGIGLVEVYNLQ